MAASVSLLLVAVPVLAFRLAVLYPRIGIQFGSFTSQHSVFMIECYCTQASWLVGAVQECIAQICLGSLQRCFTIEHWMSMSMTFW